MHFECEICVWCCDMLVCYMCGQAESSVLLLVWWNPAYKGFGVGLLGWENYSSILLPNGNRKFILIYLISVITLGDLVVQWFTMLPGGAMVHIVTSQQSWEEGCEFDAGAWSLSVWSLHLLPVLELVLWLPLAVQRHACEVSWKLWIGLEWVQVQVVVCLSAWSCPKTAGKDWERLQQPPTTLSAGEVVAEMKQNNCYCWLPSTVQRLWLRR